MKRILAALPLLLSAVPARAMPKLDESKWVPAVYFDAMLPGSQVKHLRDERAALCFGDHGAQLGCGGQFSSYAALGGRLALYNESEDYRWGGSVGLLSGGPDRGRVTVSSNKAGVGSVAIKTQSTLVRALGEATQKWLITDDLYGAIGASFGMAVTNETVSCTGSGALGLECGQRSGTRNFGWFAWELTPSLIYQELELGLRYAGFARGGRLPWNTLGLTLGFRFL